MITLNYQIFKQKCNDMTTLTIGSNLNSFDTNFSSTLFLNIIHKIKIFSHFQLKFFRYNYQLLWEQHDRNAYIYFPQVLRETECLPYIINKRHKHLNYITIHEPQK